MTERVKASPMWFIWCIWGIIFFPCIALTMYNLETIEMDYYPIWWAGKQLLQGNSLYGSDAIQRLAAVWGNPGWAKEMGYLYPFTTMLLALPLSLLPYTYAFILWTSLGITACFKALQRIHAYAPFLMIASPWTFAIGLGQAHIFATAGVLWWWIYQSKQSYTTAWFVATLTILFKPQVAIGIWITACWMLIKHRQRPAWLYLLIPTIIGCLALILDPYWIPKWLEQISSYNAVVDTIPWAEYLPVVGLMSLLTPWFAILGVYLFNTYVRHYVMIQATILLLLWPWQLIGIWILLTYAINPFEPRLYIIPIILTCIWHIYATWSRYKTGFWRKLWHIEALEPKINSL